MICLCVTFGGLLKSGCFIARFLQLQIKHASSHYSVLKPPNVCITQAPQVNAGYATQNITVTQKAPAACMLDHCIPKLMIKGVGLSQHQRASNLAAISLTMRRLQALLGRPFVSIFLSISQCTTCILQQPFPDPRDKSN